LQTGRNLLQDLQIRNFAVHYCVSMIIFCVRTITVLASPPCLPLFFLFTSSSLLPPPCYYHFSPSLIPVSFLIHIIIGATEVGENGGHVLGGAQDGGIPLSMKAQLRTYSDV